MGSLVAGLGWLIPGQAFVAPPKVPCVMGTRAKSLSAGATASKGSMRYGLDTAVGGGLTRGGLGYRCLFLWTWCYHIRVAVCERMDECMMRL